MTQTAAGFSTDAKTQIVDALNQCVAETAVTTMLAQNFHWNVTGMAFGPLRPMLRCCVLGGADARVQWSEGEGPDGDRLIDARIALRLREEGLKTRHLLVVQPEKTGHVHRSF